MEWIVRQKDLVKPSMSVKRRVYFFSPPQARKYGLFMKWRGEDIFPQKVTFTREREKEKLLFHVIFIDCFLLASFITKPMTQDKEKLGQRQVRKGIEKCLKSM